MSEMTKSKMIPIPKVSGIDIYFSGNPFIVRQQLRIAVLLEGNNNWGISFDLDKDHVAHLDLKDAENLMRLLWDCGVRPTKGEHNYYEADSKTIRHINRNLTLPD